MIFLPVKGAAWDAVSFVSRRRVYGTCARTGRSFNEHLVEVDMRLVLLLTTAVLYGAMIAPGVAVAQSTAPPPTECLAPDGYCPGERTTDRRLDDTYNRYQDDKVTSDGPQLLSEPARRNETPPPTECLAPEGFCP